MKRIEEAFKSEKVFVSYLTAGDGGIDVTVEAAKALVAGGVNVLEIGIPFTDPVGDGPVIQQAATRALENGTTPQMVLEAVRRLRQSLETPIILMTYYNPILQAGEAFLQDASTAGVDGILVVDLPPEFADEHLSSMARAKLAPIMLVCPNTPKERIAKIEQCGRGFLYYACRKGTTGERQGLPDDFVTKMTEIKAVTDLPVVTGFGIADSTSAREVLKHCDGFVVGSAFVRKVAEGATPQQLQTMAERIDPRSSIKEGDISCISS